MLQASMFFGNLFVYFQFQGKTHIDEATRQLVFSVLIAVAILGVVFLATLKPTKSFEPVASPNDPESPTESMTMLQRTVYEFKSAIQLFATRDMLLLSLTFFYTGNLNFYLNAARFSNADANERRLSSINFPKRKPRSPAGLFICPSLKLKASF